MEPADSTICVQGHVEVLCEVNTDASVSINCDENTQHYLPKLTNPDPVIVCPNWENERPPMALLRVESVVPFQPVVSIHICM